MGLDARYDSDQRKSLSAIAFKQRQSQTADFADADAGFGFKRSTFNHEEETGGPATVVNDDGATQSGHRTEQAVMH